MEGRATGSGGVVDVMAVEAQPRLEAKGIAGAQARRLDLVRGKVKQLDLAMVMVGCVRVDG